ncbi:YdhK family protein [Shouchella patagoniensis]|uniref:YdhK family protein n=1 Tax=Shouchella patagoniensis TaxID=228576 RepID=UPI000995279D|nr:YdhK family protein [Shouchella patagoniensis]
MKRSKQIILTSVAGVLLISACGTDSEPNEQPEQEEENQGEHMDHSDMDHSSSGELPEGLQEADNPTYAPGTEAMIAEGHMEGMEGATATIVGAFDTTAYIVSYTTEDSQRVEDHKWVVHEEIVDAGDEPFEAGSEVILNADHMAGMEGATAEIEGVEDTTVYMIDYTSTTGEDVENHKWVTEEELTSIDE